MTPRQRKLLQAIINEFVKTAEAVGSAHLARKYGLDLSPATIRNEMADLMKMGYLKQSHSSSGRVPTTMGYKEVVKEMVDEIDDLDLKLETMIKEELFQNRFDLDDLIYKALEELSKETNNVSFAVLGNRAYYAGLSAMTRCPEYADSLMLERVLKAVENHTYLREMLNKYNNSENIRVLFGDDTGIDYVQDTALVYKLIKVHGDNPMFLGVIGPMRMNYPITISVVDFVGNSINNMLQSW
jgi:heat-inducible transcriptional repressor